MSFDLAPVGAAILQNPLAAGAVAKLVTDLIKQALKKTDESGVVVEHKGAIQPIVYVLTALTAVLSAAMEGQASAFDPSSLSSFAVQMLLGAFGTHTAVKGAKAAVADVKAVVKK